MKYLTLSGSFIVLFALTACQTSNKKEDNQVPKLIGMPNPASVYCAQLNGKSILVDTSQGQYANCKLPNGEIIEEWALYHRDHSLSK